MFTAAEISFWGPDEALHELKAHIPIGWKLTIRDEEGYSVAELYDELGNRAWFSSSPDIKLLYLNGLGWLMTRNHKPGHPAWKPRDHEVTMRVPNPTTSHIPDPADLDPAEVSAVYRKRR